MSHPKRGDVRTAPRREKDMSLYNMIAGFNPLAPLCVVILRLHPSDIPRWRDAWLSDDGQEITVLTRTGGGNRETYADTNEEMRQVAGFISDEDDDFDSTFARFRYSVPENLLEKTTEAAAIVARSPRGGASKQGPGAMVEAIRNVESVTEGGEAQEQKPDPEDALKLHSIITDILKIVPPDTLKPRHRN